MIRALSEPLLLGESRQPIAVSLTVEAVAALNALEGAQHLSSAGAHRSLLMTIVVAYAAAGRLEDDAITIEASDIMKVLSHAGTVRS